jgi:hypothetical protein
MAQDDLFQPTLHDAPPRSTELPFHSGSMFVPAFFGGPLTFLYFALTSARRLGLPAERRRVLVAVSVGMLLVALIVILVLDANGAEGSRLRFAVQAAGVVTCLIGSRVLRAPERRHALAGGEFEPIGFGRGLVACLVGGAVQAIGLAIVFALVT